MKTPSLKKLRRGFTILELIVAMAITTIIVSVLVGVTSVALDAWNRSRAEVRAARQAKSMIDTMGRDFESFVVRKGNDFEWLYASVPTSLPGPNSVKSTNAADLIFFSGATDRYSGKINTPSDLGGDVSAVIFQLNYQDPVSGANNGFSTFTLNRLLVNPDQAFRDLLGKTDLNSAASSYVSKVDEVQNFVCENVYQFSLTFNVEVQKGTTKVIVPVPVGSGSGQVGTFQVFGTGNQLASAPNSMASLDELKAGRLTSVEIAITVLSDGAINQMRNRTFNSDEEKSKFISANSYQYSKLVELPSL